jgi:hypothetical protein
MPRQTMWRWCDKCQGFSYAGNPTLGTCPAGGAHNPTQSGHYDVIFGDAIPGAQNFWRWCHKCQGMFYTGNPDQGHCPASGTHDGSQSGHYSFMTGDDVSGTQGKWRWCHKCQGMFYSGNASQGTCPAGGAHDGSQSQGYGANWEFGMLNNIVYNSGFLTFTGGTPVGGWANVSLFPDGSYNFDVNFHDSGFTDYNVGAVLIVRSSIGQAFTFAASGHMCGTDPFCGGSRDFVTNPTGKNQAIADGWADLSAHWTPERNVAVNLDVGTLWNGIKSAAGTIQSVVNVVGPLFSLV